MQSQTLIKEWNEIKLFYLLTKANSEQDEQKELPLFIDGPEPPVKIYKKFGLDPDLLKDPLNLIQMRGEGI